MDYSNTYEKLRLDELGISSEEEAEELEYELELRFEDFTPRDRKIWLQQNEYLEHFSSTGTVTSAAKKAGVTIFTAQRWKYDDVLGFTRRHEVATLIFNDRLKQKALLRANDPNAPATLLIELLRAYIPEEFSKDGHKCDSSKSDELLRRLREDAGRNLEAGLPTFHKMAEGAENTYSPDDLPTEVNVYQDEPVIPNDNSYPDPAEARSDDRPTPTRHSRAGGNPQTVPGSPVAPTETGNTPPSPHNPSAPSARSAVNPLTPERRVPPEPRVPPTRAQRREQLRQQRKEKKKNTFPVKRF